ncbi:MAG TPA: peptidylprolyl isomerase [Armatimonadota bacterium]|nr:peptidylprolyl isomerase [Armatimonadota bacterium]
MPSVGSGPPRGRRALIAFSLLLGTSWWVGCARSGSGGATHEQEHGAPASAHTGEGTAALPPGTVTEPFDGQELAADQLLLLRTSRGDLYIEVDARECPVGASHFVRLAREGYLAGRMFDRAVRGRSVHAGAKPEGAKLKDPDWRIVAERSPQRALRGYVFLDRDASSPELAEAVGFRILRARDVLLEDGEQSQGGIPMSYVGRVVKGLAVVDAIEEGDTIQAVSVVTRQAMGKPDAGRMLLDPGASRTTLATPKAVSPEWRLRTMDGQEYSADSTLGRALVLTFVESGNKASEALMDALQEIRDRVAETDLLILVVAPVDQDENALRAWAKRGGWTLPLVSGRSPRVLDVTASFMADQVPLTWIVDSTGVAVEKIAGGHPAPVLLARLELVGVRARDATRAPGR